jgi:hypothetical protein
MMQIRTLESLVEHGRKSRGDVAVLQRNTRTFGGKPNAAMRRQISTPGQGVREMQRLLLMAVFCGVVAEVGATISLA